MSAGQTGYAYADGALPIECGQTISQPYMVGRMTELLELKGTERVLEIGTGSGYQAAILALLTATVFTIERQASLLPEAEKRIGRLGLTNLTYRVGDGTLGWPEEAPFDAIMVTAGAPQVPPALREQLAPGGRLVAPVGPPSDQTLVLVRRGAEERFEEREVLKCRFVKLIGAAGWPEK